MTPILDQLEPRERHDLKNAVQVVRFAVEALREGDRFDGEDGREQLLALDAAVSRIEEILGMRGG
jgi:hypothetical protein